MRGSGSDAQVVYEMEANPETQRACGSRPSLRLFSIRLLDFCQRLPAKRFSRS